MRVAAPSALALLLLTGACHRGGVPDAVKQAYDNRADQIDRQAEQQPTDAAEKIYKSRADAVREEGEDRKKGLEKAGVKTVPPMPVGEGE